MSIEKQSVVGKIEILEHGAVQVRVANRIFEDGVLLSETFSRHVVTPGDDFSNEDAKVVAVCAAIHTSECVAAYSALTNQGA
jgi:hypothetical protein